jgi:hypothetical protein
MATEPIREGTDPRINLTEGMRLVPRTEDLQVVIPEAYNLAQDRVRWGPIWAGFFTAITTLILLSLLGIVAGLVTLDARSVAAQNNVPPGTATAAAIWGGLATMLAFFLGGFAAARTAAVFDRRWGAWNGAVVFLMGMPVILLLAGFGLGGLVGTLGSFVTAQVSAIQGAVQGVPPGQVPNLAPADVANTAAAIRNAALSALIGSLLALGAAALGGVIATRRILDVERVTARVERRDDPRPSRDHEG